MKAQLRPSGRFSAAFDATSTREAVDCVGWTFRAQQHVGQRVCRRAERPGEAGAPACLCAGDYFQLSTQGRKALGRMRKRKTLGNSLRETIGSALNVPILCDSQ